METNRHNYLKAYQRAVNDLHTNPDDDEAQYKAVLALARAGSTDFALKEYRRYGLDKVHHHEDIIALGGRLYKDKALKHTDKDRKRWAQLSSEKYEQAFQETGGYFSGVNAATMALLAGFSNDMVKMRAEAILKFLPPTDNLESESKYYIEATRGECYLLLGDGVGAQKAMECAWAHDPLNYTAHASSLKQFRMILDARGETALWLSQFSPPMAVHFAGHMFSTGHGQNRLSDEEQARLKTKISEHIQKHDIGFGYGALAAGSDILIAETLLEEGAQVHIVLPVARDVFIEHSVTPYGARWQTRFENVMENATSIQILSQSQNWPSDGLARYGSRIAMGKAIMRAKNLFAACGQFLIWDGKPARRLIGTSGDAELWARTELKQIILDYTGPRGSDKRSSKTGEIQPQEAVIVCARCVSSHDVVDAEAALQRAGFEKIGAASTRTFKKILLADSQILSGLQTTLSDLPVDVRIGLDYALVDDKDENMDQGSAHIVCDQCLPGSIYTTERFAAMISTFYPERVLCQFVGVLSDDATRGQEFRTFSLELPEV